MAMNQRKALHGRIWPCLVLIIRLCRWWKLLIGNKNKGQNLRNLDHMDLEDDFKISYENKYQRRTKNQTFQLFVFDNRKALRGFVRVFLLVILLLISWVLTRNYFILFPLIPIGVLAMVGIVAYVGYWLDILKFEREQLASRAFVGKRTLRFGDFGIIYEEHTSQGVSREKYAWVRYKTVVEWEDFLILIPAKKKADSFIILKNEMGEDNFKIFKEFASSKLSYKEVTGFMDKALFGFIRGR